MANFNDLIQRAASSANSRRVNQQSSDLFRGQSLKKMTRDMVLQFPILASQNIAQETAATIADGFEVENTIMLRLLLQNDFGTLTSGSGDLITSLRKVHTNIEGSAFLENILATNKALSIPIEDKFCKWSLNEGTLPKYLNEADDHHGFYRTTDDSSETTGGEVNLGIASVDAKRTTTSNKTVSGEFVNKNPFDPDMFKKVNDLQPTFVAVKISVSNSTVDERTHGIGLGGVGNFIPGFNRDEVKDLKVGLSSNMSRTSLSEKEVIFGVKCMVHPIKSEDIIFNIGNEFKNSTLFRFVKWTTGEYSFFKGLGEVIFDFTNMKNTGIQAAKTSNYWWYKLRKLKMNNKTKFFARASSGEYPIKTATLVITKDEVDYIANTYRIDLSMPKFAQQLMDRLFLLNFCYVDEASENVYLYDESARSYTVKKFTDFKRQKKPKAISIDDVKSLFGR